MSSSRLVTRPMQKKQGLPGTRHPTRRQIAGTKAVGLARDVAGPIPNAGNTCIWQLVRSVDYEQIHSFVNSKFRLYRASYLNIHGQSEDHFRTEFNKASYSKLAYEWLCHETLKTRSFRHHFEDVRFIPMVCVSNLNDCRRRRQACKALYHLERLLVSRDVAASSRREFLHAFNESLWTKWSGHEERMRSMTQGAIQDLFLPFLLQEYYVIMSRVLITEFLDRGKGGSALTKRR